MTKPIEADRRDDYKFWHCNLGHQECSIKEDLQVTGKMLKALENLGNRQEPL
jgi:hypothetical protein